MAASAKPDGTAATEAEWLAFHVDEFHISLDEQGTVIANCDFRWWHFLSLWNE